MTAGEGVTILQGDCRETLKTLPAESVHMCVTSPPYWGLRDYGTGTWEGGDPKCDHRERSVSPHRGLPNAGAHSPAAMERTVARLAEQEGIQFRDTCGKCGARRVDRQIGLEPTPEAHIAALLEVFRGVWRVLRNDGQLWLNYGDCYACAPNGRKAADIEGDDRAFRDKPFSTVTRASYRRDKAEVVGYAHRSMIGLKPKDLVGMPWRVALALQADGWWLRSAITWAKRGPMPESVTDRPASGTEMLFLLTRSQQYFYDNEAVRPLAKKLNLGRNGNLLNWWLLSAEPTPEAHFATFPSALVEPCILAGTSDWGCCPECGAPWARVTEKGELVSEKASRPRLVDPVKRDGSRAAWSRPGGKVETVAPNCHREKIHQGWRPTCHHPYADIELVPAIVLDPFGGSGTVSKVASRLGRRSILCELNPEYIDIAHRRTAQRGLEL